MDNQIVMADAYRFRAATKDDMEIVLELREKNLAGLRTSFLQTKEMQNKFYTEVLCNTQANSRFWIVETDPTSAGVVGMVGIEKIEWENRTGELSFLMKEPEVVVFHKLMDKAFNEVGLKTVVTECYACNPIYDFWVDIVKATGSFFAMLPHRKFWKGVSWGSMWFQINSDTYIDTMAGYPQPKEG